MAETQRSGTISKAARAAFLDHLAITSNVTASAQVAGVPKHGMYAERRRSAAFAAQWQRALCEGYARLEAELLAEALRPAGGTIKDMTLKTRQMKTRLGLALLSLHRAAVRGEKGVKPGSASAPDPKAAQARLESRFATMRARIDDDDGL